MWRWAEFDPAVTNLFAPRIRKKLSTAGRGSLLLRRFTPHNMLRRFDSAREQSSLLAPSPHTKNAPAEPWLFFVRGGDGRN